MTEKLAITPRRSIRTWSASALAGAVGLAGAHGFDEPIVADATVRIVLAVSLGLFVLSRLLMLVPLRALGPRLRRWWVDYVLIAAAGVWWTVDHTKEPVILPLAAGYSLVIGAAAAARAAVHWVIEERVDRPIGSVVRRLFLAAAGLALAGGAVLALPKCWAGSHPISWESTYAGQRNYELATHGLNCLFTATAAMTGTGLAVYDVGHEFTRVGQVVILVLMQVGGLAILIAGAAVGWPLRRMIGWQGPDDDTSPAGLRRLIGFVGVVTMMIEAAGVAVLFARSAPDANHLLGQWQDRLFDAIFHAVSALCNVGLTLSRDSLIHGRDAVSLYGGLLPLMVLGSIGGPPLYELCRRLTLRSGHGLRALSKDTWITLLATLVLVLVGAGLLFGIESTLAWQLRYPQDNTPERLEIPSTQDTQPAIVFSCEGSSRVRSERLRTMPSRQRGAAAVFHSVAARTGGMHTARLDESSLSPASRVVLMAWMLIGGAVGGSAGGLRIVVVVLLISAARKGSQRLGPTTYPAAQPAPKAFSPFLPASDETPASKESTGDPAAPAAPASAVPDAFFATRRQAIVAAAGVAASMLVLIGLTTFVLAYRQAGSLEACLFEAVSAGCNVGFSTGLTPQLAFEDHLAGPVGLRLTSRAAIILAMLLGRVLPLGILLRCTRNTRTLLEQATRQSLLRARLPKLQ